MNEGTHSYPYLQPAGWLVENGVDPTMRDGNGKLPADLIRDDNSEASREIAALLRVMPLEPVAADVETVETSGGDDEDETVML